MAGKQRADQSTVMRHFVALRLADAEWNALHKYIARETAKLEDDVARITPASVARQAVREFLKARGIKVETKRKGAKGR